MLTSWTENQIGNGYPIDADCVPSALEPAGAIFFLVVLSLKLVSAQNVRGIHGFADAIGEEDQCVARLKIDAGALIPALGEQTYWRATHLELEALASSRAVRPRSGAFCQPLTRFLRRGRADPGPPGLAAARCSRQLWSQHGWRGQA